MSATSWGGRKVKQLVALTLGNKGTVCHLCGYDGADSADHDPPRSELLRRSIPNPDDPCYLWPAHRYPCNVSRNDREITDELKAELRVKREQYVAAGSPPAGLSPRFRRFFPEGHHGGSLRLPISPPGRSEKTGR